MIRIKLIFPVLILSVLSSCENKPAEHTTESPKADTTTNKTVAVVDTIKPVGNISLPPINDSLNDLANFISGNASYNYKLFSDFRKKNGLH